MQETLRQHGARHVVKVLRECGGNRKEACKVLGITPPTLNTYLATALEMVRPTREIREGDVK